MGARCPGKGKRAVEKMITLYCQQIGHSPALSSLILQFVLV
ncbi:hypothetical protein EAM_1291 [Erwinia amylovora ATCC 49946]|nr:hypothetical protein EAM_1291 [Erwinia amylovora ATCC 49946]